MENIHIDSGVNFASRTKLSSGIQGLRLFASQGYQQLFSLKRQQHISEWERTKRYGN